MLSLLSKRLLLVLIILYSNLLCANEVTIKSEYHVLLVKGEIYDKTNGKKLASKDRIYSNTLLKFSSRDDFVCLINTDNQHRFVLRVKNKNITQKFSVRKIIHECYAIEDDRSQNNIKKIKKLQYYFGDTIFLIFGTEQTFFLDKEYYPKANNAKIRINYQQIQKEIEVKDYQFTLSQEYFAKSGNIEDIYLIYLDTKKEEKFKASLKFLKQGESGILEELLSETLYYYNDIVETKEEKYEYFYQAVRSFYGKVDEYYLYQFFEKNYDK